jgi:hypothetical protein
MIHPLTKRERLRVLRYAEDFIAYIPDAERWAMLDGAHRSGLTTKIEIDLSDPTDVSVTWLGRKILTVHGRHFAAMSLWKITLSPPSKNAANHSKNPPHTPQGRDHPRLDHR